MRSLTSAVALLWLALAGCGTLPFGDGPPDPDGGPPDSGLDCPNECPGTYSCASGVVSSYTPDETGCNCIPVELARCTRGCRTDGIGIIYAGSDEAALVLCEENRPKHVGDPCSAPEDCLPEVAEVDYATQIIENVYLRCDLDLHQCGARDAPVISDWLATCGLGPDEPFDIGAVDAPACSGGLCLIFRHDGCLHQGCTARCTGDGECPVGTLCDQGACEPPSWIDLGDVLTCPAP
jgi:hypothetical protein